MRRLDDDAREYVRVSTDDQNPALQHDALTAAGCERVWTDHASGTAAARPQLAALLDYARPGDVITVWRLDRLGRSVKHVVETVSALDAAGVEFRSLTEGIDTTTANGRLVFHFFAAVAEFEVDLTRERTRVGLAAARARGRVGGTIRNERGQARGRRRASSPPGSHCHERHAPLASPGPPSTDMSSEAG